MMTLKQTTLQFCIKVKNSLSLYILFCPKQSLIKNNDAFGSGNLLDAYYALYCLGIGKTIFKIMRKSALCLLKCDQKTMICDQPIARGKGTPRVWGFNILGPIS